MLKKAEKTTRNAQEDPAVRHDRFYEKNFRSIETSRMTKSMRFGKLKIET